MNNLLVILSSWWLLYAAKDEVKQQCAVLQQYLPINKQAQEHEEKVYLTPSQLRKGVRNLFDTFDKKLFYPKSRNNNYKKKHIKPAKSPKSKGHHKIMSKV